MTKRLMVGDVAVGGGAPVSIQSMCNTRTDDVAATVAQIHALEAADREDLPLLAALWETGRLEGRGLEFT